MKIITNGRIITDGRILDGFDIAVDGEKIVSVKEHTDGRGEKVDLHGMYIAPGFIDLHCHGGGGYEFIDATEEAFEKAAAIHFAHGTRVMYPTISATDYCSTVRVLECARRVKNSCKVEIPGVHLEGPYLAKEMCGGQAEGVIRDINREEYCSLLEKYGDIIARWDYAPEKDRDGEFAKALKENGTVGSTAHSSAEYSDILSALKEGNRLITHLYSCTSTVTRHNGFRHLGVVESAFLLDELFVEIICDGCHLPKELIKMVVKIKGDDRVCLITDALRPAGKGKEGEAYLDCAVPFVIEDGVAKLLDKSAFAGSIATSDRLVKVAADSGIDIASAVKMITQTPAEVMGLKNKGRIAPGFDALFTVFDGEFNVYDIFA